MILVSSIMVTKSRQTPQDQIFHSNLKSIVVPNTYVYMYIHSIATERWMFKYLSFIVQPKDEQIETERLHTLPRYICCVCGIEI